MIPRFGGRGRHVSPGRVDEVVAEHGEPRRETCGGGRLGRGRMMWETAYGLG